VASLTTLERRIAALEARLADVEGGYGDTLYKLHRHAVGTDLTIGRIAQQLGVSPATDDEIDAALEEERSEDRVVALIEPDRQSMG